MHAFRGQRESSFGYFSRLQLVGNYSALSSALMMVARERFDVVGGFDEDSFPIAYADVDFCLRLGAQGYRHVYTPYATAWHAESVSRSDVQDDLAEAQALERLVDRHSDVFAQIDPCYSPNLSSTSEHFGLRHAGS